MSTFLIFGWNFPSRAGSELTFVGGQQAHGFHVGRVLAKRGHKVIALCLRTPTAPAHEVLEGIEIHRFGRYEIKEKISEKVRTNLECLKCEVKLAVQIIESERPDFAISWQTPDRPVAFFLSKMYGIPFVATAHGLTGVGPLLINFINKIVEKKANLYHLLRMTHLIPDMLVLRRADLVETVSEWSKKQLIDYCGIDCKKIFVTGNGVDIERYKFCEEKEDSIVVLGALLPHKRVDMAIRILKQQGIG